MRIAQLNCVFAQGSTGKLVSSIHEYLKRCGDVSYVLYGLGSKSKDSGVIRVVPPLVRKAQSLRSRITGFPYGGSIWGTHNTINELKKLRPDLVHIHCYNAYIANIYKVLNYLKAEDVPTVITNHAEFMFTGGCTHALDCNKWISGCGGCEKLGKEHPISWFFDRTADEWKLLHDAYEGFSNLTICCVSDWLRDRASQSPFYKQNIVTTVLNGLDTEVFRYRSRNEVRAYLGINNCKKVVIHVTPDFSSPIKGGKHVLEMAKRMPEVLFVIVGDYDGVRPDIPNVHFVGRASDQVELAKYYSAADVCLLTSKAETFSMVTAESLCCGTPVVGFEAGGPESIAISEYTEFIPQEDEAALEKGLRKMFDRVIDAYQVSIEACELYGQEKMCAQYRQIYERAIHGLGNTSV